MKGRSKAAFAAGLLCIMLFLVNPSGAVDSDASRKTLCGVKGVYVIVEELQPNLQKYGKKNSVEAPQLKALIESLLNESGIKVLTDETWLTTPGRPVLYLNVNTHEYEKLWYAYDIRIELRQLVMAEINPSAKTLAPTWSLNVTGVCNIGTLGKIREQVSYLVKRFAEGYKSVNQKK
jgi:hypothetical protein